MSFARLTCKHAVAFCCLLILACTEQPDAQSKADERVQPAQQTAPQSPYIGRTTNEISGAAEEGGALIDPAQEPLYALDVRRDSLGMMVWLTTKTGRDAEGSNEWRVLDVLRVPEVPPGHALVYTTLCSINNRPDPEIVAIARNGEPSQQQLTTITRAWRANREKPRFEEIATSGVACENEGYGV
jgi:hypothetical protein